MTEELFIQIVLATLSFGFLMADYINTENIGNEDNRTLLEEYEVNEIIDVETSKKEDGGRVSSFVEREWDGVYNINKDKNYPSFVTKVICVNNNYIDIEATNVNLCKGDIIEFGGLCKTVCIVNNIIQSGNAFSVGLTKESGNLFSIKTGYLLFKTGSIFEQQPNNKLHIGFN